MITFNKRSHSARSRRSAFTMVEIMVSVSLFSVVMASVVPTFGVFAKSAVSLGNYSSMSQESRSGLELLARDFRATESLELATPHEIVLTLQDDAGGGTISYVYDANNRNFTRIRQTSGGVTTSRDMFNDVDEFSMVYFNRLGEPLDYTHGALLAETKSVQLNAKLMKEVIKLKNTDYIISARFLMRNK